MNLPKDWSFTLNFCNKILFLGLLKKHDQKPMIRKTFKISRIIGIPASQVFLGADAQLLGTSLAGAKIF